MIKKALAILTVLIAAMPAFGGQVTGLIQSAGGVNLSNATLTWTPTQFAVVAGSFVQTAQSVNCYTDAFGNVVGLPNPLVTATASAAGGGFLSSGITYYIQYTITGAPGETAPSPELAFFLPGGSTTINITAPVLQPVGAAGYKVYASTTSGGEKLQATVSGFGNTSFSTLAVGASVPSSNTSTCNFNFSDSLIPQARYVLAITDSNGSPVPGWPQTYYTQGATFNLNTAVPTNQTTAIFQNAIVSTPTNGATQSIFSALNLNGFGISGLGPVSPFSVVKVSRDCRIDGVVADGVTNDRVALNNCLANAYVNGQNVRMPAGKIHIQGGAIDDTNKPVMVIEGTWGNQDFSTLTGGQDYGPGVTQIMCDNGTTVFCWDATGSGQTNFKNFSLRIANSYATPAMSAFLLGRDNAVSGTGWITGTGTYCFSANIVFDGVYVNADSLPAATVLGRIGIYNQGSETFTIKGGKYIADLPLMFGTSNVLGLSSTFQTLGTGCPASMTEVRISGTNLQAWTRSAIRFDDIFLDFQMDQHTEILNGLPGSNTNAAFSFSGSIAAQLKMYGQVENFTSVANINGAVDKLHLEVSAVSPTAGLVTFNGQAVTDSIFSIRQQNGSAQPLINATSAATNVSGSIIHLGSLSGVGAGASNITYTGTIYAPGITDANVNLFASGSQYEVYDASGHSIVGGIKYVEGTAPAGVANSDVCYGDSTLHGRECNYNNSGYIPVGSRAILTADWTCGTAGTVASCTSATIIGSGGGVPWTFTLPLVANSLQLDCDGVVGQATAATSNQWNLLTATNGATNITATYDMYTAATAKAGGAVTDQASTTTTFQISPNWTLGGTATKMPFHIHASVESASTSGTVLSVQLVAPTVGDLVTIYRGSGCWIHP